MEARKTSSSKSNTNAQSSYKAIEFVGDVKTEIKRIHWTDKEELKTYTKLVIASTFMFGMGIYLVDLTIQGVLVGLSTFVRLFIGF